MSDVYDLLIAGAGPAGLEAALQANKRGLRVLLTDREEAGSLVWNTMRQKKFYHAYDRNTAPPQGLLDFPDRLRGEELVRRWRTQAEALGYQSRTSLTALEQLSNGYYRCTTTGGSVTARFVVLASGTHQNPKKLGIPGEDICDALSYSLDYGDIPMDQHIVVIGGGNTAVETALECALDNEVVMVVRKPELRASVTEKNQAELSEEIERGTITLWYESRPTRIDEHELKITTPADSEVLPFDHLYIHIGFESPREELSALGLALNDHGLPLLDKHFQSTSLAGVYVVGALTGADSVVESANQAIEVVARIKP